MGQTLRNFDIGIAAELYNSRFDDFGQHIKTVGWGNEKDQKLRFEVLFRGLNPTGKIILDVGCGFGDLVKYLDEKTNGDFQYIGIDVAEKLISHARSKYGQPKREFYTGDIFTVNLPQIDISVLSGALSLKVDGVQQYAHETMKRMYEISQEAASLNFLSKYVDFELEKNQHYQPEIIYSWAKEFSTRVNLINDYPLYEFTIQMLKYRPEE
ncbi:MAG: methyltransferase domain-containing protein [Bacteroidia bacterium]|nr:methyltransferase domain-containing protein [Bacteroidia bacterium]